MNEIYNAIQLEVYNYHKINHKYPTVIIVSHDIFNGFKNQNERLLRWNPNEYTLFGIRLEHADINGFVVGDLIKCEVKENE